MASGCACARAPDGRSSRPAAARAAPRFRFESVLPKERRLRRSSDISSTIRQGRRAGATTVVVHAVPATEVGHARLGLAVSKTVGNSVVRHRVARRLRHVFAADVSQWDAASLDVVIRALPAAAGAGSNVLAADLTSCRERLARRASKAVAT